MATTQERYLNTVQIEIRNETFIGSLAELNETIFYLKLNRMFDDGIIFKGRERAAYFFEVVCAIKWRVLIHKADKNLVAERLIKPVENLNCVVSVIWQDQMTHENSTNHLPADNLHGTDQFKHFFYRG